MADSHIEKHAKVAYCPECGQALALADDTDDTAQALGEAEVLLHEQMTGHRVLYESMDINIDIIVPGEDE